MSGPIAMVVAGLLIGNVGRTFAMSPTTVDHLDMFWELIDEVLNAVLFVLIGVVVLALTFTGRYLLIGLVAIPIVLLARLVSVAGPLAVMSRWGKFAPYTTRVLTWGGLRGGISVALALSIPPEVAGPAGRRAGRPPGADLRRGGVLDPGPGADRRPAHPALAPQ